jgi:hypothetical protein
VDKDHLAKLKSIVQQRREGDPPLQIIEITTRGGSPEIFSDVPAEMMEEVEEMWAIADSDEARAAVLRLVEAVCSANSVA